MELLKLLSANEIVAQTIAFLILLVILRKVFWGKFLKILDGRKERIASELQDIERARSEVGALKNGYESRLASIDEAAHARVQEAIKEGRRMADDIRRLAQADAEKMVENAKESIKTELAEAKEQLKEAAVDLAIHAAEHVVQERLSTGEDRKVVERFLKEMDKK